MTKYSFNQELAGVKPFNKSLADHAMQIRRQMHSSEDLQSIAENLVFLCEHISSYRQRLNQSEEWQIYIGTLHRAYSAPEELKTDLKALSLDEIGYFLRIRERAIYVLANYAVFEDEANRLENIVDDDKEGHIALRNALNQLKQGDKSFNCGSDDKINMLKEADFGFIEKLREILEDRK